MKKSVDNYIREFGVPDLIHVHSSMWEDMASFIKQKYGIPYVITEHRVRFGYITSLAQAKFKSWYAVPLRQALSHADMIIPVSKCLNNNHSHMFMINNCRLR